MRRKSESTSRNPDQHLKAAVQRDLLMSTKRGGAQTTRTPDDGTDARAFAASEDAA